MLVLLIPSPSLHRLCVDKRCNVIGAYSGWATLSSPLRFWDLLNRFCVPLSGNSIDHICFVTVIPLRNLSRCQQAFQRHADRSRNVPNDLVTQLDLCWQGVGVVGERGAGTVKRKGWSLDLSSAWRVQPIELLCSWRVWLVFSSLDLMHLIQDVGWWDYRGVSLVYFCTLKAQIWQRGLQCHHIYPSKFYNIQLKNSQMEEHEQGRSL